jgi:hypothetical protein
VQTHILDGVGGQESVLNVEERCLRVFGGAAGDQSEIACLLGVTGVEDTPAAVGDTRDIIMSGVDIEGV